MDAGEVERELDELETRIERLRALYEQYFMGLEKLEPLVPRKDVERRIWVLRREQIRNTGLRFKFQMLIQRFNTFQQYWGRISREIENGTYRRDVLRVARRFGEKEALTIFGRRRAAVYAALAAAQEAGRRRPSGGEGAVEELSDDYLEEAVEEEEEGFEEAFEEVIEEAIEDDADSEDEAPTLIGLRFRASMAALQPGASPGLPSPLPPLPSPPSPLLSPSPLPPPPRALEEAAAQQRISWLPLPPAGKPQPIPPPRPSDPEAARRRVAQLAAQGKAPRDRVGEVSMGPGPLELDLDFDAPRTTRKTTKPPPRRGSSTKMGAVKSSGGSGAPGGSPRGTSPAPRRQERPRASVAGEADARAKERDGGDLEDKRLQQIYAKYIETRRTANEPTAGITYEKLAQSLRAQAAKLRESHPAKSVDYDVVIKNGKTLLKPILR